MIALIPARAGSKRCPGKNTRLLGGQPLWRWTYDVAVRSGVFERVYLATDDERVYVEGAAIWRQPVPDAQPDVVWVREALAQTRPRPETFAILRPTSPFRTVDMLIRAFTYFRQCETSDSIRAVEPVTQTPYKMWTWKGRGYPMEPLLTGCQDDGTPYHSSPTQACPQVYIQNSSLEMAWTRNVEVFHTIHGRKVSPFFTTGSEGFAIDCEADWREAERRIRDGEVTLPALSHTVGGVSAAART